MNTSNRFGIESMAREQQAEIERELRAQAERRNGEPRRVLLSRKARWAALAIGAIGLSATVATILLWNTP